MKEGRVLTLSEPVFFPGLAGGEAGAVGDCSFAAVGGVAGKTVASAAGGALSIM